MESPPPYIRVSNLSKTLGSKFAVDDLSFTVGKGSFLGLLGPNGAGKSTTMRSIVGITSTTCGYIEICGIRMDKNPYLAKNLIGYLPENPPLYLDMYLIEYLEFIASMRKISKHEVRSKIETVIKSCGLELVRNKKLKTLSKGYKQRVGIAQAIIHEPRVLLLDEPTTGLDPVQIIEIRNLLRDLAKDRAVIISTHIMQEVEAICTDLLILKNGKMQISGPIADITKGGYRKIIVEFKDAIDPSEIANVIENGSLKRITEKKFSVKTAESSSMREEIFLFAKEKNYVLLELSEENTAIEELFYCQENVASTPPAEWS